MYTKKCSRCGNTIEYETQDQLKEQYYFKGGYCRNVCKKCECEEHAVKYAEGKYNYAKKRESAYDREFSFGSSDGRANSTIGGAR